VDNQLDVKTTVHKVLRRKLLAFLSERKTQAGQKIPEKYFIYHFYPSLSDVEKNEIFSVRALLVEEGVLFELSDKRHTLTPSGYALIESGKF
jgi:hypothetical protein